jgi:hypothetical protein
MEIWVIMAENVFGQRVPTGLAQTEAGAYRVAQEAIDALSLTISLGASKSQVAAAERIFETIRVRRARIELLDE